MRTVKPSLVFVDGMGMPPDKFPVRKAAKPNAFSRHALIPSRKNRFPQETESRLELFYCYQLELNPAVLRYQTQPIELRYRVVGQKRERRAVPDIQLWMRDGSEIFVDVKPASEFAKADVRRRLRATRDLLAREGREYRVVSDQAIYNSPMHSNVMLLKRHFFTTVPSAVHVAAIDCISSQEWMTLSKLDVMLSHQCDDYILADSLALIARGEILFDFATSLVQGALLRLAEKE